MPTCMRCALAIALFLVFAPLKLAAADADEAEPVTLPGSRTDAGMDTEDAQSAAFSVTVNNAAAIIEPSKTSALRPRD